MNLIDCRPNKYIHIILSNFSFQNINLRGLVSSSIQQDSSPNLLLLWHKYFHLHHLILHPCSPLLTIPLTQSLATP